MEKQVAVALLLIALVGGPLRHPDECPPEVACDWSAPMLNRHESETHVSAAVDPLLGVGREATVILVSGAAANSEFGVTYTIVG